ncbi:hypothetical protein [Arthrobacter sp. ISL-72]|uniref:hypothetical protein n=1 Tax=Arthrobacter sp. ISL-72 TaxID=2819114 RepID=UPI001BEAF12A|nr:hypothetical protein [Arthrobacter sp. ISL-72]MBT2594755.1 hypothetical protein [Arthrobacter sp. ISL-72]
MTEQPVETEQGWLGNVPLSAVQAPAKREAYLPNGHRLPAPFQSVLRQDIEAARQEQARAELAAAAKEASEHLAAAGAALSVVGDDREPDLWLDTEDQTTRALREIQDGNINAGIACLQAALAFALNYRHSLAEETTR